MQLIGAEFEWSGMVWRVTATEGERCLCERPGSSDGRPTLRLHRETVAAMVLSRLALRPEERAA